MARFCAHVRRVVANNRGGDDLSLQTQSVQPTDFFYFNIAGILREHNNNNNNNSGADEYEDSTLFEDTICIRCEHFFSIYNQEFLSSFLGDNQPCFPVAALDYLSERVITQVQTLCPLQMTKHPLDPRFPTFEPLVFQLYLEIVVHEEDHDDDDIFQLGPVRMIPASNEAIIQSLKKVPSLSSESCCTICMNEDEDDDDKEEEVKELSVMPCGHGFHHTCIVQWLNTSHMCPICRYALPTSNDD